MSVFYDGVLGDIRIGTVASGNAGASVTEIVSGGSLGYIPVLSGGKCYRFTDPLLSLSIGSITSTLEEADVLFTAGATITPAPTVTVRYLIGEHGEYYEDEDVGGWEEAVPDHHDFVLSSTGSGGYVCNLPVSVAWENYSDQNQECDGNSPTFSSYLAGGSFTCTGSGGSWVISAHNIIQHTSDHYYVEVEGDEESYWEGEDEVTSRVIDGWVASSTDNMQTWTINTSITIRCCWWSDLDCEMRGDLSPAAEIVASATVIPCSVALPSGAKLINSSAIVLESGHQYELNAKYGAIVMGDVVEAGHE